MNDRIFKLEETFQNFTNKIGNVNPFTILAMIDLNKKDITLRVDIFFFLKWKKFLVKSLAKFKK